MANTRTNILGLWSDLFGNRDKQGVAFWRAGAVTSDGELVTTGNPLPMSPHIVDEFILKTNTKYLLRVTNSVTTNNYYNIELNYYVHPGV